jgi:YD repeat-containing protein
MIEFLRKTIETQGSYWYAYTRNKALFDSDDENTMDTVVVTDGFSRAALTAKKGLKYNSADKEKDDGWNVSGQTEYDSKGRAVKQYMNRFVEGGLDDLLSAVDEEATPGLYTGLEYDELDRTIKQTLPDGAATTTEFSINSENESVTKATDPLGNTSRQYADGAGNIVRTEKAGADGSHTSATYGYNGMGEMLAAYDERKNAVTPLCQYRCRLNFHFKHSFSEQDSVIRVL